MCDPPAFFVIAGRKEAVMNSIANLNYRSRYTLPKTSFITYLLKKGNTSDKDNLVAKNFDLEDWSCIAMNTLNCTSQAEEKSVDAVDVPYFLASVFNEFQVSFGFTSKMFPSIGMPGGCGIAFDIATSKRWFGSPAESAAGVTSKTNR
jgi:hypothetical protein